MSKFRTAEQADADAMIREQRDRKERVILAILTGLLAGKDLCPQANGEARRQIYTEAAFALADDVMARLKAE